MKCICENPDCKQEMIISEDCEFINVEGGGDNFATIKIDPNSIVAFIKDLQSALKTLGSIAE